MARKASDIVGAAEACDLLGIDRSTIARWVQLGKLKPAHKLPGLRGAFLFHRRDIEALRDAAKPASDEVVA